jgi:E3 ubiquitin-protein ligase MARCH6
LGRNVARRVANGALRAARVVYTYFFVLVVFPLLVASLMELYLLIPLHEVMDSVLVRTPPAAPSEPVPTLALAPAAPLNPPHTIRVVQTWTVGLLYLRLGARVANVWFEVGRVSSALRAVFRRGWLDPDAAILTRAFVVPGLAIWAVAVAAPLCLAKTLVADGVVDALMGEFGGRLLAGNDSGSSGAGAAVPNDQQALYDAYAVLVYRVSFPLAALLAAGVVALWSAVGVLRTWQVRIRDEAYLIGERLHNFGGTGGAGRQMGAAAWRAGGARI